jgi:hypothetical protein
MPPISITNSNWLGFVVQGRPVFLNIMYMNFKLQRVNDFYTCTLNVTNITIGQLVTLLSRTTSPPFIVDAQVRSQASPVGFVVNYVEIGQVFLRALWFACQY